MHRALIILSLFSGELLAGEIDNREPVMPETVAIVIHGGAGTIERSRLTSEMENAYREKLSEAVSSGHELLKQGKSSREAVLAAVTVLEDSELFNAGRGSVLNHVGNVEMDASIMVGQNLEAGAVASVKHIKNPILLADKVMTDSPHVMLIGEGAEQFAESQGFEFIDNEYFKTERRREQLKRAKQRITLSEDISDDYESDKPLGTVGAVAIDQNGVITAATSTGGMTNKQYGRVGDSPIIGAGTYANERCGISATGHGEYFIRANVAHDICARAAYQKISLAEAADFVVGEKLVEMGGDGGVIGIDAQANVIMPFNSSGMYRAAIDKHGVVTVEIFKTASE